MTRSISIFGATGSVGLSTLDLIRANRADYRVVALTANGNCADLAKLAQEFEPEIAVCADEAAYPALKEALAGTGIETAAGAEALIEAARRGAMNMGVETPLLMLAGISAGVIALMPFASAAVLRINLR